MSYDNLAEEEAHSVADAQAAALEYSSSALFQILLDAATHVSGFQYGSHDITSFRKRSYVVVTYRE
ncbi:hypothetical protein D3C85_1749360 [compost metagenome]